MADNFCENPNCRKDLITNFKAEDVRKWRGDPYLECPDCGTYNGLLETSEGPTKFVIGYSIPDPEREINYSRQRRLKQQQIRESGKNTDLKTLEERLAKQNRKHFKKTVGDHEGWLYTLVIDVDIESSEAQAVHVPLLFDEDERFAGMYIGKKIPIDFNEALSRWKL